MEYRDWGVLCIVGLLTALGRLAVADDAAAPLFTIVPAPNAVTIDGELGEWNTGGKFGPVTFDEEVKDDYHGTFYARYDQENLYLTAVIVEPHPPYNTFPKKGIGADWGDVAILRMTTTPTTKWPPEITSFETGPEVWVGYYWWNDLTKSTQQLGRHGGRSVILQQKELTAITTVVKVAPDGKGYTVEIKLPWAFLNAAAPRPKPGDAIALSWEIVINNHPGESHRTFQIIANGAGDVMRSYLGWGKAVFK